MKDIKDFLPVLHRSPLGKGSELVFICYPYSLTSKVCYDFRVGSHKESREKSGISHFLEHMMFKGTSSRTKNDISVQMENLSADMNAYTSPRNTFYHASCPNDTLEDVSDIFFDMVFNSVFPEEEIEREKDVVTREISMSLDNSMRVAYYNLVELAYGPDSPFGRRVLGWKDTLHSITREDLLDYYRTHYVSENMKVFVIGGPSLDFEKLKDHFTRQIENVPTGRVTYGNFNYPENVYPRRGVVVFPHKFDHVMIDLFFPVAVENELDLREKLHLEFFASCLQRGFTSPFFRIIRDEHGLVYSIGAFGEIDEPACGLGVYGSTSAENVPRLMELVKKIVFNPTEYVTHERFDIVKRMEKKSVLNFLESKNSILQYFVNKIGKGEDPIETLHTVIDYYDNVTYDEVMDYAKKVLKEEAVISLAGKTGEKTDGILKVSSELFDTGERVVVKDIMD